METSLKDTEEQRNMILIWEKKHIYRENHIMLLYLTVWFREHRKKHRFLMSTWELKKNISKWCQLLFLICCFQDCSTNIVLLRDCCSFDKLLILVIDVSAFHRENLSIAFYWIHSGFSWSPLRSFCACIACLWFGIALQTLNPLGVLRGLCLISEPSIYISLLWYQFGTLTLTEGKTCSYWGFPYSTLSLLDIDSLSLHG